MCGEEGLSISGASSSSPVMIATVSGHFGESSCRMRNRRDWWVGDAPLDQSRSTQYGYTPSSQSVSWGLGVLLACAAEPLNHKMKDRKSPLTQARKEAHPRDKEWHKRGERDNGPLIASCGSLGGSKWWSSLVSHLLALSFMGSFLMMVKEASRREEKKQSFLTDGLLAKIEALALRKLAMFKWDPLFSP
ncbi:hypothetical protein Tco_0285073 [Tanacetum coccineum]